MNKFHKEQFFATSNKVIWPKLYQLLPIKYELKLPSEVMPGLLPFRFGSKRCATCEGPENLCFLKEKHPNTFYHGQY